MALFPVVPEDLGDTSLEDAQKLLADAEAAVDLIVADDKEFLGELSADEVIAEMEAGVADIQRLRAHVAEHEAAHENYKEKVAELKTGITPKEEEETEEASLEVVAEEGDGGDEGDGDEGGDGEEAVEEVAERELVTASAEPDPPKVKFSRTPPAPAPERIVVSGPETPGAALVAAGDLANRYKDPLDPRTLADLVKDSCLHHGPAPKRDEPGLYRFGGPEHKIARAQFEYPSEFQLTEDLASNSAKILEVIPQAMTPGFGKAGQEALTASGGLCAPLTPIYSMPNFASEAEPVWDSLPKFQAARGGVNVPAATYIADITTAISSISEANDALGGTFATKSCQDLTCPAYTETAVQILAHCREYGNLNARAWPEKIAHENALTMAALARTTEDFLLERIKALSVNVTNGTETLGALIYLVDAITKAMWGIRGRLRMDRGARFRVYLPVVIEDIMKLDTVSTQFDRYRTPEAFVAYLRSIGVDPVFYIDGNFAAGDDMLPDASQGAGALDGFPNTIQWAIHPDGAFLGIDSGTLELGIVRDSVLNATNDFQVFGERFRNVALLAPAQAAYWVTTDLCPTGQFPPAGTARTCE